MSFFTSLFEPFFVMYQTNEPMILYMYNDLQKLLRKLILLIVKPDLLQNCKSATDMKNLDLRDKSNLLKLKNIDIGFAVSSTLNEFKRKDPITNGQTPLFFNDVMLFICCIVQQLLGKSSISYNIVCNSLVFDPQVVVNENIEDMQCKLKKLLEHLIKLKILDSFCCGKVLLQFVEFVTHNVKLNSDKFKLFDRYKTKLDPFYFQNIGLNKYKELKYLMKVIVTLSHGQASVERCFRLTNQYKKSI